MILTTKKSYYLKSAMCRDLKNIYYEVSVFYLFQVWHSLTEAKKYSEICQYLVQILLKGLTKRTF